MNTNFFTLHIVFSIEGWNQCKVLVESQDRVLLIQDGVYLAHQDLSQWHNVYARSLDTRARNIQTHPHIEIIDDEQWLELTEHAKNIMSW